MAVVYTCTISLVRYDPNQYFNRSDSEARLTELNRSIRLSALLYSYDTVTGLMCDVPQWAGNYRLKAVVCISIRAVGVGFVVGKVAPV